jgi:glycosyltransferase involved in cell wall biosynthesis
MRLLFVKERLAWPRSSGHDVHGYHLMRALGRLGHDVSLATLHEPDSRATEGAGLVSLHSIDDAGADEPLNLSKLQERFRNYWGIPTRRIQQVGRLARELQADAVVAVGLNVLPYLAAVRNAARVWYGGDESVWHHLSQFRLLSRGTWGELKEAMVKGLYERAYRSMTDRVWMVSDTDRRAFEWVCGLRNVDVIRNGIDSDYYAPVEQSQTPRSCIFWGRLDFGPNIQALEWFCKRIWPRVRRQSNDARFTICGFQPTPAVRSLVQENQGITLIPDLPDIRPMIGSHEVVVLPFVSGGGIKNKLLEAAAMSKAIVCTPRAVRGLSAGSAVVEAASARAWAKALLDLWEDGKRRQLLGTSAREWVLEHHTWEAAASVAAGGLARSTAEAVTS